MQHKIEINGIQVHNFMTNGSDIIIPGGRELLKNTEPVRGKIMVAYYLTKHHGSKKWRVEFKKEKQELLGHNKFSVYFHLREDAAAFINKLEN